MSINMNRSNVTAEGILKGTIGIGKYIVNDYVLTLEPLETGDGYTLTIRKGSDVQTVTLEGLSEENLEIFRGYVAAAQAAQLAAEGAQAAAETAQGNADDAQDAAEAAQSLAETAQAAAETAETNAGASATQAGTSASSAAQSATQAGTSASSAAQSATQAAGSAAAAAQTLTDVQAAGQLQIAAIGAEGERVLETIPEDYTELSGDVSDLKTQIDEIENAVEMLDAGSLSAIGSAFSDVPVSNGDGTWEWRTRGYITPQMFGAKGDGETDDAQAIKDCIDYALENGYSVFIPAGTYIISPQVITIDFVGNDSLTIFGCGKSTCIKRKDNSLNNKWDRLFVVDNSDATTNSGSFIIRDLYIDSNRRNQSNATMDNTYDAAADLIMYFSNTTYGIDTVLLENLWFYDAVADHIDFTGTGVVNAENIIINNVFASGRVGTRNDIDFPGIPKKNVYISNVSCQRIHNEYNGTPTAPQYYFYNNVKCTELTIGGTYANVKATNVCVSNHFSCGGIGGDFSFVNCTFDLVGDDNKYLIADNGKAKYTFADCVFNSYDRTTAGGAGVDNYATYLYLRPGYDIVFDNCRFIYKGQNQSVTGYPICWLYTSDLTNNTVIRGCYIDPKFSNAFVLYSPATVLIEDVVIKNPTAFWVQGTNGKGDVTFKNVELKSSVENVFNLQSFASGSFTIKGELIGSDNYSHIVNMSNQSQDENNIKFDLVRRVKITEPLTKQTAKSVLGTIGSYCPMIKGDTLEYAGSNPELYPDKWVAKSTVLSGDSSLTSARFESYGHGHGATADRPACFLSPGFQYYDTDLGKMIMWDGSAWKNLDGTALS